LKDALARCASSSERAARDARGALGADMFGTGARLAERQIPPQTSFFNDGYAAMRMRLN
jgi:hypothetical protein